MAKKRDDTISSVTSKYSRYEKSKSKDEKCDFTYTQQQSFDFSEVEDLDSTKNLDVSFVDGKRNKKSHNQEIEVLDIDEVNKANAEFKEILAVTKENKGLDAIVWFLIVLCLFLLLAFTVYRFFNIEYDEIDVLEDEIVQKTEAVDDNYIFLGDEITEDYDLKKYYGDLPVVNSGVSEYTTNDLLERMNEMVYQYNPSKVFILIGINDLILEASTDGVINNIELIIKDIKDNRPYSKIYLESIYPVSNNDTNIIDNIVEVNEGLIELAKEEEIIYIDVYGKLVGEDGLLKSEYTVDGVHISDEGYERVTEVLKKYVLE